MHRGAEPSRLQSLALQLADKVREISLSHASQYPPFRVEEGGGGICLPPLSRESISAISGEGEGYCLSPLSREPISAIFLVILFMLLFSFVDQLFS